MRRKVLIVQPDGMFSTIYTEGAIDVFLTDHDMIELIAGNAIWQFAPGVRFDVIELQGRAD